jgi:hypothetical protein
VGLKLAIVDNVLTFQIKQAPLLPHFYVDSGKSDWKATAKHDTKSDNTTNVEPYHWKLMMKELTVPENTVLTGIGFRYDSKKQLDIQLKYTPVWNASAGTLDVKSSGWMAERFDAQR